jgi:aspartate/methionine/tyrosine aminotransferase
MFVVTGIVFDGGKCVPLKTCAAERIQDDARALRAAITPKTRALIFPFPNTRPAAS